MKVNDLTPPGQPHILEDRKTESRTASMFAGAAPGLLGSTFPTALKAATHDSMAPRTGTVRRGGISYCKRNARCAATIDWLREN